MEKSLSFFRVFDIAFFAPGILLFAAIGYHFFPEIAVANSSIGELNNHRLKAGGFELRTESPDTRRLNDASTAPP
ncbi:MAG: hypothetical protein ACREXW_06795 [Gammaproteobacteria bacterium]